MTGTPPRPPRPLRPIADSREPFQVLQSRVAGFAVLAGAVAVLGLIVGLAMALHATRIACPNGTIYSGNTPPKCFSHNHTGEGTSIAVICLVLIVLVVVATLAFNAIVDVRAQLLRLQESMSKLEKQLRQSAD